MAVELFKIVYQVCMTRKDDDGNTIDELATQQPLTLYPHQLGELPDRVKAVLTQTAEHEDNSSAP